MKLLITALLVMLGLGYIAEANEAYVKKLQLKNRCLSGSLSSATEMTCQNTHY